MNTNTEESIAQRYITFERLKECILLNGTHTQLDTNLFQIQVMCVNMNLPIFSKHTIIKGYVAFPG